MDLIDLGKRIRDYRKKLNMTQTSLANTLNISAQAVSKWEKGDNAPDILILIKLSRLFGISVDALLGVNHIVNHIIEATIFVSDIQFFTKRAKPLDPKEIATIINAHYYQLTETVLKYDGVPIKYVGDEFMCFFSGENHEKRAAFAALKAKQMVLEPLSIGISTGEIFLGKMGHPDYAQTDIMGQCVSHAHLLCSWARKKTKSGIGTYEKTLEAIKDAVEYTFIEDYKPVENREAIKLYELMKLK